MRYRYDGVRRQLASLVGRVAGEAGEKGDRVLTRPAGKIAGKCDVLARPMQSVVILRHCHSQDKISLCGLLLFDMFTLFNAGASW